MFVDPNSNRRVSKLLPCVVNRETANVVSLCSYCSSVLRDDPPPGLYGARLWAHALQAVDWAGAMAQASAVEGAGELGDEWAYVSTLSHEHLHC